ncbi:hypothetical protein O6P43_001118 [Quillaja saponaria]|uniref:Uncharacterized protein n=1 Tax=Quillaja saponaria TaxID=32244 RepID=A0AAD7VN31_QUISA|nr:hypothetical protein O6P43_001118 [Quillaja saponaria]
MGDSYSITVENFCFYLLGSKETSSRRIPKEWERLMLNIQKVIFNLLHFRFCFKQMDQTDSSNKHEDMDNY